MLVQEAGPKRRPRIRIYLQSVVHVSVNLRFSRLCQKSFLFSCLVWMECAKQKKKNFRLRCILFLPEPTPRTVAPSCCSLHESLPCSPRPRRTGKSSLGRVRRRVHASAEREMTALAPFLHLSVICVQLCFYVVASPTTTSLRCCCCCVCVPFRSRQGMRKAAAEERLNTEGKNQLTPPEETPW